MLDRDFRLDIDLNFKYKMLGGFLMDPVEVTGFGPTQSGGRGERHGGDKI